MADKKTGEGVYKYASGDVYKGSWSNDLKHGQGSYFFKVLDDFVLGRLSRTHY